MFQFHAAVFFSSMKRRDEQILGGTHMSTGSLRKADHKRRQSHLCMWIIHARHYYKSTIILATTFDSISDVISDRHEYGMGPFSAEPYIEGCGARRMRRSLLETLGGESRTNALRRHRIRFFLTHQIWMNIYSETAQGKGL